MSKCSIGLTVNGRRIDAEIEPRTHLADFVREELLLTATHLGCEQGVCGACTVMKDGRPVRGCLTLAVSCRGAAINTLESFDEDPLMNSIREAFKQHHGLQCGFCTPGMLATAYDLVRRLPDADEMRIRKEISGNLCRCTGYQGAVNAIKHVLADDPPAAGLGIGQKTRPQVTNEKAPPAEHSGSPRLIREGNTHIDLRVPERVDNGVRLTRTVQLAAPVDRLRELFQDVTSLAACIPGAEVTGPPNDDPVRGFIAVAIGPMHAHFDGVARVRYREEGLSGNVIGRGQDRLSRSQLDGALEYTLRASGADETELHLDMTYRLNGLLAQVGRPAIVERLADLILEETVTRLVARATGSEVEDQKRQPMNSLALLRNGALKYLRGLFRRGR